MTLNAEKTCLQIVVAIACLVPLTGGIDGIWQGASLLNPGAHSADIDSHVRYLSGLLLGIGLAFIASLPRIESHAARFRLLTAIVIAGGLARLFGMIGHGLPGAVMTAALGMELVVTPLICLWQNSLARRWARNDEGRPVTGAALHAKPAYKL